MPVQRITLMVVGRVMCYSRCKVGESPDGQVAKIDGGARSIVRYQK